MKAWNKDLSANGAKAYKSLFSRSITGQYTDASEQHPVVTSSRFNKDTFLLDAGCGNGRFLANAAPEQRFVGLDISLEMVKLAKNDLKRGLFVVGELDRLPFREGVFDQIICSRVLQHIKDQGRAIGELGRTCESGGSVIVLSLNSWTFHCLYKNFCMSSLARIVSMPFQLLLRGRTVFSWGFAYDNYCSMPELCGFFRKAGLAVVEKKGGTIGCPWVFGLFGLGKRLERYAPRPLRLYFRLCRVLEDRLGTVFPFSYLLDKIIVKGVKQKKPRRRVTHRNGCLAGFWPAVERDDRHNSIGHEWPSPGGSSR